MFTIVLVCRERREVVEKREAEAKAQAEMQFLMQVERRRRVRDQKFRHLQLLQTLRSDQVHQVTFAIYCNSSHAYLIVHLCMHLWRTVIVYLRKFPCWYRYSLYSCLYHFTVQYYWGFSQPILTLLNTENI